MRIEEEGKEIAKPILNIINEKVTYHTRNINEDITKLIQRIEPLELKYEVLNNNCQMMVKKINDIKDDIRRLDNDLSSNYEVLVELNRRVDTITGETPVIPRKLQSNDDDTEDEKMDNFQKACKKLNVTPVTVQTKVITEVKTELEQMAKEQNCTLQELLRDMIDDYILNRGEI